MGTKRNPGKFDCYAKAKPDEPYFMLLARDPLAPFFASIWSSIRLGDFEVAQVKFEKMIRQCGGEYAVKPDIDKAFDALQLAMDMFKYQSDQKGGWHG